MCHFSDCNGDLVVRFIINDGTVSIGHTVVKKLNGLNFLSRYRTSCGLPVAQHSSPMAPEHNGRERMLAVRFDFLTVSTR